MVGQVRKKKPKRKTRTEVIERWLRIYEARTRAGYIPLSIIEARKNAVKQPLE
jgi:hypothetical protein